MKTRITLDLSDEERLFAGIVSIARSAAGTLVDDDTADDVAQDVALEFLELLRTTPWTRDADTLNAFVVRRARDRALDTVHGAANRLERERDWMLHVAEGSHAWMEPDRAMEESELAEVQRRTLEALPPTCRRVFVMVRDGERSYDDVARTLGVSRSAICQHVSEAQRRFRYELGQYGVRLEKSGDASQRRRTRGSRSASTTMRSGGGGSRDDRPWLTHSQLTPWSRTAFALVARSPPAVHTHFAGGFDADKAGKHAAIAPERGSVPGAACRRTRERDADRCPAEARRRHRRARDARR